MRVSAHSAGRSHEPSVLLVIVTVALTLSGINPYDRLTWLLEVLPVLLGVPILVATRKRFPLTPLAYRLIAVHALILIVGAHYTYSRVPLGFWLQKLAGLSRNHYDRIGHLAQGFVPAVIVREILLRRSPLAAGGWLFFLVTSVCLALSALYELIEWWAALVGGKAAEEFLATQGDVWDTQWDMLLALSSAILSQLLLGRSHDRAVARLSDPRLDL